MAPSWLTYSVSIFPMTSKNMGVVASAQYSSPYPLVQRTSSRSLSSAMVVMFLDWRT